MLGLDKRRPPSLPIITARNGAATNGAIAHLTTPVAVPQLESPVRAGPIHLEARKAPELPRGSYYGRVKPVLDVVLAALLLVLLLPVILVVAVAVRLSLGPGIIFRQQRIGLNGSPFTVFKFRTMKHSRRRADLPFDGPDRRVNHKDPSDPRHTPTGRFLRRLGLDEIPQLVNVLRGDMSLVGPRPELPEIVAGYAPWQHRRHAVRPGITGLWQVSARMRPMHKATDVDLEYIDHVSLVGDAKILGRTLPALMRRHGW